MNKSRSLLLVAAVVLPIIVSVAIVSAATWTPPSESFPNGSPAAPIDTGASTQTRTGQLNIQNSLQFASGPIAPLMFDPDQYIGVNGFYPSDISIWPGKTSGSNYTTKIVNNLGYFDLSATRGLRLPNFGTSTTDLPIYDTGTITYDPTSKTVQLYNGTDWQAIGTGAGGGGTSQWDNVTGGINYAGGNVGIGTTNPAKALEVAGDVMVANTNKIGFRYSAGDNAFYNYITAPTGGPLTLTGGIWTSGATQEAIRFETGTAGSAKMSILNNGNVGIGTTNLGSVVLNNSTSYNFNSGEARLQVLDTSASASSDSLILRRTGAPNTHEQGILFADDNSMQAAIRAKRLDIAHTYNNNLLFFTGNGSDNFQNDNTAKMVIDYAGNVGIGTSTPGYKLTTYGSSGVTSAVGLNDSNNVQVVYNTIGNIQSYTSGAYGNLALNPSGGNVGIGTTTPGSLLHLYENNNTNNAEIALQSGNGTTVQNKWSIYNNGIGTGDGSLRFWNTNVSGDKNALTITKTGDVGIGTTNPNAKLEIKAGSEGQTSPAEAIRIWGPNGPASSNSAQDLKWDFSSAGSAGIRAYRGSSWDTYLQFLTNASTQGSDSPQVRMTISDVGNVGIGTATPGAALDVYSGDLMVNDGYPDNVAAGPYDSHKLIFDGQAAYNKGAIDKKADIYLDVVDYSNSNLTFQIDGSTKMALNSTGGLSVGRLVASGDILSSNLADKTAKTSRCVYVDNSGVLHAKSSDCGTGTGGDNLGNHIMTQNLVTGNYWISGDGSNEGIRVDAYGTSTFSGNALIAGNVGIGTTTPSMPLEVNGNMRFSVGTNQIQFANTSNYLTNNTWTGNSSAGLTMAETGAYPLIFKASSTEYMRILATGNVGIGTTTPQDKLSVEGGNMFINGGNLKFQTITPPASAPLTSLSCTSGGSLPNAGSGMAYYYSVSYTTDLGGVGGETPPSNTNISCNPGNNGMISFTVTKPTEVNGVNIYRGIAISGIDPLLSKDIIASNNFYLVGSMTASGNFTDSGLPDGKHPSPINTSAGGIYVKEQSQSDYKQVIGFSRSGVNTSVYINGQIIGKSMDGNDASANQGPVRMNWVDEASSNGVGYGWYPYAVYAP